MYPNNVIVEGRALALNFPVNLSITYAHKLQITRPVSSPYESE